MDLFTALFTEQLLKDLGIKTTVTYSNGAGVNNNTADFVKFKKKPILTEHEREFLKRLKDVTDKYYLHINLKTRLADVFDVSFATNSKEWGYLFNRIKSKHIDFTILDSYYNVICFVELDDTTHLKDDRKKRDEFLDKLCVHVGYKLIHTYGDVTEVERYIANGAK
jgi:hypothetical protein